MTYIIELQFFDGPVSLVQLILQDHLIFKIDDECYMEWNVAEQHE